MTNEEIKEAVTDEYRNIQTSKERLEYVRSVCKHEHTYECLYGETMRDARPSNVCWYCGQWVSVSNKSFEDLKITTIA